MKKAALLLCAALLISALRLNTFAEQKKQVALTFDDGPHYKYTAEILKILADHNIPATFFVVGENAEKHPELVRAAYDMGHEIGNHTYSHKSLQKTNVSSMLEDIKVADKIIYDITGEYPKLFRPPEGKTSKELFAGIFKKEKQVVFWSIDTRDWAHTPVDTIVENVTKNVCDRSIILFHDFIKAPSPTPEALRRIIPILKEQGYEFVTVSQLYERQI